MSSSQSSSSKSSYGYNSGSGSYSQPRNATQEPAARLLSPEHYDVLPTGWEMGVTRTGRVYYVNHSRRETTWNHPDKGALPSGWEERVFTDGRLFYVNHTDQATSWVDPRAPAALGGRKKSSKKKAEDESAEYEYCTISFSSTGSLSCTSTSSDTRRQRLIETLECPLCLQLLYKPTTTACAHTFCEKCVRDSIKKAGKACPLCRSPLYEVPNVNVLMVSVIEREFPREYSQRKRAIEPKKKVKRRIKDKGKKKGKKGDGKKKGKAKAKAGAKSKKKKKK